MENRKKVLIVFVIFIAALTAFIFYDPSPDAEKADSEDSSDAVVSEQDDTASKEAWYYSVSDTQSTLYAEFWISGNSKYSYHTWESSKDSQSDVKEKEITGKCKKQESRLFYWVDGKKHEGIFQGENLIIDDKVFLPLSEDADL